MRKRQVVLRVHEMSTSRELERTGEATERRLLWPRHEAKQGRAFPGCEAAVAVQQSRRCAISNRCAMSQRQDAGRVARSETGKIELIHTLFGWRSGMCLRSGCVTRARLRGGVGQCPIALHVRLCAFPCLGGRSCTHGSPNSACPGSSKIFPRHFGQTSAQSPDSRRLPA